MESIKIKLISLIAMICLVMGIMIVGIFSAQTQQIKLNGQVNFEIGDKSLYVKDVRLQENTDSSPYSLSEQGRFMPGYVNGEFNMNLGNFTNTYGSFALYFDIINTVDETSGETFAYTTESSTTQSGVTVTTAILDSNGSSISQIPQGTLKPSEITSSSPISATIKLTVSGTSGANVDLSQITITISEYVPQVYDYFDFEVNSDGTTVTLIDFNESLADTTDIVIPDTVSYVDGVWMDGNTYIVTDILDTSPSNAVFHNSGITSIKLPSTLETTGKATFGLCTKLIKVDLSNCTSLNSIGASTFQACTGLIEIDLSNCTSLTSIGGSAFYGCYELKSITLPSSLTSIAEEAFDTISNLETLEYKGTIEQWLSIDFGLYWMGDDSHTFIVNGEELTNLVVPEGVQNIGNDAFNGCSGLTSITLPSSLASIGSYAFIDCDGLTNIDLSNCTSLTSIGSYAFAYCDNLSSIKFPNTTGWYATTSSSATTGTPMDMSNPEQNAEWLTAISGEDYYGYYFKCNA